MGGVRIETELQALARFKETWPKIQVQDRVGRGTRVVGGQQLSGFIIYKPNGSEGWMVLVNGIVQTL
jgi:hypothetical protein